MGGGSRGRCWGSRWLSPGGVGGGMDREGREMEGRKMEGRENRNGEGGEGRGEEKKEIEVLGKEMQEKRGEAR